MRIQRRFFFLALVLGMIAGPLPGLPVKTLIVGFERHSVQNGVSETTRGTIFFRAQALTLVHIQTPVNQWMLHRDQEMLIYYPDEQKAFRITSTQIPFFVSFFQAFLGVLLEDFGLTSIGYTLARCDQQGDVLISHWNPPAAAVKSLGSFLLEYQANRLVRVELNDPRGQLVSRTLFRNHQPYGNIDFPGEILSERFQGMKGTETVLFIEPRFNVELPAEAVNFSIPAGVSVKEVQW